MFLISVLDGNNTAKTSGITKSFRVDEDIIRKIDRDARTNNISLNAKINNVLRKYVDLVMLANKVGMIPIARPIVSEIFQEIMTKDQVIDLANRVAKNAIRELVLFMKGSLTLESFLLWLMISMEYCSELNYTIERNSHQVKIIFKHDLGENWSIYHKIITEYIFYEILGQTTVQIEASNSALILCFG
jgi:hypothetical protein